MSRYYLLIKDNDLYKTTSNNYMKIAKTKGYKYVGMAIGKNVSVDGYLLDLTKQEKKEFKDIDNKVN